MRHSKGCVMLVFARFGIVLPNFSFASGSMVERLINKYEWSDNRMMMRETLHAHHVQVEDVGLWFITILSRPWWCMTQLEMAQIL